MSNIVDYLDDKGVAYTISGDEAIVTCPECRKPKLSININTEVYKCWVCSAKSPNSTYAKGHFSQLKELWGDVIPIASVMKNLSSTKEKNFSDLVVRYHHQLRSNPSLMKYLFQRGINEESIDKFQLGFVRMHEQDWVSIPSYEDGIPKLIKYRKGPNDENPDFAKYLREEGGKTVLFNGDVLDSVEEVFIAEGELDAITLLQNGYENTVGITAGAGTLTPEWYDKLVSKSKIYLVLDPDDPGQIAARDIWATRLGRGRCWNIKLPDGEDVNSYFTKWSREEFDTLIESAERFTVSGIISLRESFVKLFHSKDEELIETPWKSLNKLIGGGFAKQRLIVIGGAPGAGKTSMALQILYHVAKEKDIPGLVFCLEMPEISLATKVAQLHYDLTIDEIHHSDGLVFAEELGHIPLYFGYSSRIKTDVFYNTMEEVRNRYGVGIGVFDNLQRMVRTGEESDIGNASAMFASVAMDFHMPFIVISHLRKLKDGGGEPRLDDLKGSQAIPSDADYVIFLHRKKEKNEEAFSSLEPLTKVIVDKSRYSGGGVARLWFEGDKSKFREIE